MCNFSRKLNNQEIMECFISDGETDQLFSKIFLKMYQVGQCS